MLVQARLAAAAAQDEGKRCTTRVRRVKHTSTSGTGRRKRTRTWYTDDSYKDCGYTVHAPGEGFLLERIGLPFGIHASPDQCVFTRWRPPR
ncbi:hypothetical protein [Streptomyces sp. NBC_01589]|uniref:hypothetical protein n=1 Tax=unclassified Streptomyces TaxID=2593676 RepID=UPI00386E7129